MYKHLVGDSNSETAYCAKNICIEEIRFIHFFSDVPQLMKTVTKLSFLFWIRNRDKVHVGILRNILPNENFF